VPTDGLAPQDLVLTIFGSYIRGGEAVWSGGMVKILEDFDFTTGAARAALSRLVNRHLLARSRHGRLAFYSATPRAETLFAHGDRRIFSFGRTEPAVPQWTVVWHAIPEADRVARSRFARRLRFLGFGSVQDATWIAARDRELEVSALLRELDLERYASVIVGRMSATDASGALIAEAWRLDEARRRYDAFLAEFGALQSARERRRLTAAEAFRQRTLLVDRFRGFPSIDPELPAAVDPLGLVRKRAVACFDEVYAALEIEAGAYLWGALGVDAARRVV
jgi:phenylacetic acid degradation operon negative regulatory protein